MMRPKCAWGCRMCPRAQPLVGRGGGGIRTPLQKNNWTTQPLRSFFGGGNRLRQCGCAFLQKFLEKGSNTADQELGPPNFENVVAPSAPVPATSCLRWVDGDLRWCGLSRCFPFVSSTYHPYILLSEADDYCCRYVRHAVYRRLLCWTFWCDVSLAG